MSYGQHKGGERWADPNQAGSSSAAMFNTSKAEAIIDPIKGLIDIKTTPKDALTDVIYRSRFGWLPELPQKALKVGEGFEHDYSYQGEMMSSKRSDEYYLDDISDGMAFFSVESQEILVYNIQMPDMSQMQGMQGMMPQQPPSQMKMIYKGDGTAIFDIKQGIFVEWEVKRAYKMPTSSMMGMTTTMQGVVRERWEMERR
jgi:secreted PhoX family phosphatase